MLKLPAPNMKRTFIINRQSVNDISALIVKGIRESLPTARKTKEYFQGSTDLETCRNLWLYLKDNVKYKAEPIEDQSVKTISRIFHDKNKGNDCKHYTTFICTYLLALGIPVKMRLVSFNIFDKSPTHIYPVAVISGKETPIDAVIDSFGINPMGIRYKKDIKLN